MSKIIRKEVRQTGTAGKIIRFIFWMVQIIMGLSLFGGVKAAYLDYQKIPAYQSNVQDAHVVGAVLALGVILFIWVLGTAILGSLVLLTRGPKVIVEEIED